MELRHGCRAQYGPLDLRIQTTASVNGFTVYVHDRRREKSCIYEQSVQGTLESTQNYAGLRAREYLNSYGETAKHKACWRCS